MNARLVSRMGILSHGYVFHSEQPIELVSFLFYFGLLDLVSFVVDSVVEFFVIVLGFFGLIPTGHVTNIVFIVLQVSLFFFISA